VRLVHMLVTTQTLTGLALVGGLATLKYKVTRPNRVHYLRLMSSPQEASDDELLRRPLHRLHAERAIAWQVPFTLREQPSFAWRTNGPWFLQRQQGCLMGWR